MADISQYLQDILDAVYGEQVRGSIHDAIEIINEASEVCIAAGTDVTTASSSSTGFFTNSLYINTNTYDLWKCVGTDAWDNIGNLKGTGIYSLAKTATVGNVDTYTITFDDGSTETFDVTNGIDGTNGSVWYKGTAISGTGTGIIGFPGEKNDFYLNSSTGGVYCCTKSGAAMLPNAAEWDYVMTLSGGGGGSTILVVDNLTSGSSTDALSANQGRILKGLVDTKSDISSLANVAFTGSYNDLTNKPTMPLTWVSDTATAGVSSKRIDNAAFKTTSVIIPTATDGTSNPVTYKSIPAGNGYISIVFNAELTSTVTLQIGVYNPS